MQDDKVVAYASWQLKETRIKLSNTWFGTSRCNARTEDMETLSYWKQIWDIYRPQEFEVYFHSAQFEPTTKEMVGTHQGLQSKRIIPPKKSQCSCRCIKHKGILSLHESKPKTRVSTRSLPTEFENYTTRHPKCPAYTTNLRRLDKGNPR